MRTHQRTHIRTSLIAATAILGLVLSGCGSDAEDDSASEGDDGTAAAEATEEDGGDAGGGDCSTVVLGYIPSWTDGLSTAYLLDNMLTNAGYTVEHQEINEPGVLYTALAGGDVDIYPSAWPEVTHASYMDEYGDSIEDLGTYYDNAKLTMAVPEYVDITSIDELVDNADMFENRIVGIEAGAGLTEAVETGVIPTYGLDEAGFSLETSSTTGMLAELDSATQAEEPIVVTLWRPFWANAAYPVKDLEDPEGALGDAEGLHFLARTGFADDCPDVAAAVGEISLDDSTYGAMEDTVVNEFEGEPAEGISAFLEEYPDAVPAVGS
ncbi:MAG TPA: glycine betaine ABC transporter substrate-binding protein [Nitriliruptoraceae bacterium]|nr:glycine betaine ABC transporter substrate-binding protein [Nitriliruptoraceae bacterium]